MAIWDMKPYIVAPLVLIILGHWSLILQGRLTCPCDAIPELTRAFLGVVLKAAWVEGQGCVITYTNNKILAATFIYSMCFDLIVLILSGSKLYNRRQSSPIGALLFKDGLFYFVIAYVFKFPLCPTRSHMLSVLFRLSGLFPTSLPRRSCC